MTVHKPVELIAANAIYEVLAFISGLSPAAQASATPDGIAETVARQMVLGLGNQASVDVLLTMLKAVGAPGTLAEMCSRVSAARDAAGVGSQPAREGGAVQ